MKTFKIIVVEDDSDIRELVRLLLQQAGHKCWLCESITAYRNMKATVAPDLIILDIMLPDGNGVELCNEIKQAEDTRNIPVLLMSASGERHIGNSQADHFLPKPFDIEEFTRTVDRLLAAV